MDMKQFVPSPTAPSDKTRVCTQAMNFRALLPLDYSERARRWKWNGTILVSNKSKKDTSKFDN